MTETRPCTRCATCCLLGPCAFGEVDEATGICKWLMPSADGSISCYQIMRSSRARSRLLGKGCVLQNEPNLFQEAVEMTADAKRELFERLDIAKNNRLIGMLRVKGAG